MRFGFLHSALLSNPIDTENYFIADAVYSLNLVFTINLNKKKNNKIYLAIVIVLQSYMRMCLN